MARVFVGIDTSKGYADFHFMDETATSLQGTGRYDDTPSGHAAVGNALLDQRKRYPDALFVLGIEASGGLERNWLRLLRALAPNAKLHQLNPLAVRKFLEQDLHRNVTDASSARGIAEYLRRGMRPADQPYDPALEGARTLLRHTRNLIERSSAVLNELQALLPSVHPDLVRFTREGVPQWTLRLLQRYPTVESLRRAKPEAAKRIPYLTPERARTLIDAARQSVASLRDADTALVVRNLCEEALWLDAQIAAQKRQMTQKLETEPEVKLLLSIPGVGPWTAICLFLACGSLRRFHSANALVAYCGLDPRVDQSGDGIVRKKISRRGRSDVRAALYMAVQTALRFNPVISAFYTHLRSAGKTHKQAATACMAKMLRIGYACVITGCPFDPEHTELLRKQHQKPLLDPQPKPPAARALDRSLDAPVTWREAKRRRAATMPQEGVTPRKRGPGAALRRNGTLNALALTKT